MTRTSKCFSWAALAALALVTMHAPTFAAINCTTTVSQCYDTRTKEYRKCTTKVCTDDKGTVVSTETVVEMKGGKGDTPKPKASLPKAQTSGATKQ